MPKTNPIVVASRTYNACTKKLVKTFGLEIDNSLPPKSKFNLSLVLVQGLVNETDDEKKNAVKNLTLDDLSLNQLRSVFELEAIRVLKKSKKNKRKRSLIREKFIRRICSYLHEECGLKKVEKLNVGANSGIYPKLNKNFKWLFKNYEGFIESDGSKPDSKLYFDGRKWKP